MREAAATASAERRGAAGAVEETRVAIATAVVALATKFVQRANVETLWITRRRHLGGALRHIAVSVASSQSSRHSLRENVVARLFSLLLFHNQTATKAMGPTWPAGMYQRHKVL